MVLCAGSGSACAACYVVIHSRKAATTPCRTRDRPMPNIRLMLWGVLAAILFLNYQTWLHDYEPPVSTVAQPSTAPAGAHARRLGASGTRADGSAADGQRARRRTCDLGALLRGRIRNGQAGRTAA